jgi:hypothetical protein
MQPMERDIDLLPRDMPAADHPLMQNDAAVRTLGDLIDVRENQTQGTPELDAVDEEDLADLDVSEALTFPHTKRRRGGSASPDDATDFDADARTASPPDDEEDAEYLTREDFVDSMNRTDPDPNTGADDDDFIGDAGLDRAPDMTGTVTGVIRGLGTHLPQDLGPDGFQIEDPEAAGDPRLVGIADDEDSFTDDNDQMDADETAAGDAASGDDLASDGGHIPTAKPDIDMRDDALDATRQLK